eukprot:Opistho-1_new@11181
MKKKFTLFIVFLFCGLGYALAQEITVSGQVKDPKGLPIPGASVKVKGSNQGAATAPDGTYTLRVAANATLNFSFIGFKSIEESVNNRTTINVPMYSALI